MVPFALQKLSSFVRSHLSILDLRAWAIGVLFRKMTSVPMSSRLFPTFSSMRFTVSCFMLRSLIHLDLSFVQGDKYGSILIFLHRHSQWEHYHLLKMLSVFPLYISGFFVKGQMSISVWVYFLDFNSILLINVSLSVPIPCSFYHYCHVVQLEVRDDDSFRSSFIVKTVGPHWWGQHSHTYWTRTSWADTYMRPSLLHCCLIAAGRYFTA